MSALYLFESILSVPHFGYECGPEHPSNPESGRRSELDEYFKKFPELAKDLHFKDFMYVCPEFFIPEPLVVEDDSEDYWALSFAPAVDEGFLRHVERGLWVFAVFLARFRPYEILPNGKELGLAYYEFAMHFVEGAYRGVYCEIQTAGSLQCGWAPHTRDFSAWVEAVVKCNGNLLELDEAGNPIAPRRS